MKTLSLNISERVNALGILNEFKGNLDKLAVILEDIKQFSVTKEEWEAVDQKIVDVGDGKQQITWSSDKETVKELEIQDTTVTYLREVITRKNDAGEFGLQDKAFISLKEKLA